MTATDAGSSVAEWQDFGIHSCYKNILNVVLNPYSYREPEWRHRSEEFGDLRYDRVSGALQVQSKLGAASTIRTESLTAPWFVSFALTGQCNLSCAHCYPTVFDSSLPFDVLERTIRELR